MKPIFRTASWPTLLAAVWLHAWRRQQAATVIIPIIPGPRRYLP